MMRMGEDVNSGDGLGGGAVKNGEDGLGGKGG
jgi:hypothetical protein